jgi:heme oxygenase (biliverdin-IX-beta and delta-forming)
MVFRHLLNLRDTLKEATAGDHAALERTGVLRAFSSDCISPAVYADYLARQWHLHRVMEPVLQGWLGAGWADARLVKSLWLQQDLATLHCAAEARQIAWDRPHSAAQALGTMYVLEGATLGIRQSVRALPATHPAHGPANRFVQGYGEHTGSRWKDFLARLEDVDSMLWPDVVAGASAAFGAFETHFSERIHAEFDESASA